MEFQKNKKLSQSAGTKIRITKILSHLYRKREGYVPISFQGFQPSSILALRTLKADVVTGLRAGQAEQVAQLDPDWMVNGSWGLIQFVAK
jgi:hypothetical protein